MILTHVIKLSKQNANISLLARNEKKLKSVLNLLDVSQKQKHDYIVADFNHPDLLEKKINDLQDSAQIIVMAAAVSDFKNSSPNRSHVKKY